MAVKPMYRDGYGDFQDEDGVILEFICDGEGDVSSLPTGADTDDWKNRPRPGSRALVLETSDVYVLSPARVWEKLE